MLFEPMAEKNLQNLPSPVQMWTVIWYTHPLADTTHHPKQQLNRLTHFYTSMQQSPISYNGMPHIHSQNCHSPLPNSTPPHLIHSSLNGPNSPPQTASLSNQPFFHNSPTRQTDWQQMVYVTNYYYNRVMALWILYGTTRVSQYQKRKTRKVKPSGFAGARDSEWQWHQLGPMQICTSPQTDNHTSIQFSFLPPNQQCQHRCKLL